MGRHCKRPTRVLAPSAARPLKAPAIMPFTRKPPLTLPMILEWIDAHKRRNGEWPHMRAGPFLDGYLGDNWRRIDNALKHGLRGLHGDTSLAKPLVEARDVGLGHLQEPAFGPWVRIEDSSAEFVSAAALMRIPGRQPRSMCPKQTGGSMVRAEVGQTDALSQSDFPTAKHGESEPDSSASSCPHFRHLPSSGAAMSVSRTSLMRRNCYTTWMESTQPTRVAATAASTSSPCQSLSRSSGLATPAGPLRATRV
jgi:hypothetical protein